MLVSLGLGLEKGSFIRLNFRGCKFIGMYMKKGLIRGRSSSLMERRAGTLWPKEQKTWAGLVRLTVFGVLNNFHSFQTVGGYGEVAWILQ
jgi:hypothetical protein